MYGQWTYDASTGLLPSDRIEGKEHLIQSFPNLRQSVISYMKNINSHKAYEVFRIKRFEYRKKNLPLNVFKLIHELSSYAELPDYTNVLENIIEVNKLYLFDNIELVDKKSSV